MLSLKYRVRLNTILMLVLIIIAGCARKKPDEVVSVNGHGLQADFFDAVYRTSIEFRDTDQFNAAKLKLFIHDRLLNDLIFQAKARDMEMENDEGAAREIQTLEKNLLTRHQGVYYQKIVPDTFNVTDSEIQAA